MKKILFVLAICSLVAIKTNAQKTPSVIRTVSANDTLTNVDTSSINFNGIGSHVKGFQVTDIKVSGTVVGNVYLQGTIDGIVWNPLDTIALSNIAVNSKVFPITSTTYNSYRLYAITSGTSVSVLTFAVMRREDE